MKLLNIESSIRPLQNKGTKAYLILSTLVDGVSKLFCYFEGVAQGTSSVFVKDNYLEHADIINSYPTPKEAIEAAFEYLGEGEVFGWFMDYNRALLTKEVGEETANDLIGRISSIKDLIGEATGFGSMSGVKMSKAFELAGVDNNNCTYQHNPSLDKDTLNYVLEETSALEKLVSFYLSIKLLKAEVEIK